MMLHGPLIFISIHCVILFWLKATYFYGFNFPSVITLNSLSANFYSLSANRSSEHHLIQMSFRYLKLSNMCMKFQVYFFLYYT